MGTSSSAPTLGSEFYTSEQIPELLSELECKVDVWHGKIKAIKKKSENSESVWEELLREIKESSDYLRTMHEGLEDVEHSKAVDSHGEKTTDERITIKGSDKRKLHETKSLKKELKSLKAENNRLRLRQSQLKGEQRTDVHSNITDLSNPDRPTKIGELYSELYDNEWANAFDSLITAGYDEEEAIKALEQTLLNIYDFCATRTDKLLTQTEEAMNCVYMEYKMLREKKSLATKGIILGKRKPIVTSQHKQVSSKEVAYIEGNLDSAYHEDLKPFIFKCIYVCWKMVVQNPQLCFFVPEIGSNINTSMFKTYTKSGKAVDFIVWPAMMLDASGAVLCKGVLQPI